LKTQDLPVVGDSFKDQLSAPTSYMRLVEKWLYMRFKGSWTYKSASLRVGVQKDSNNCGICAVNAILHAVFKDPLWEPTTAKFERVRWFCTLTKYHKDQVSTTFVLSISGQHSHDDLAKHEIFTKA
jgi:hypothetical protein